ncbi:LysR family transcriptional regulator [Fredinandcohnia sp. FSL W7-1320]|uniref:LysR family transcriptional regulator n=1 Tax=Fredinandcohnia sp. FSL W7-1320 TaxID=2954540 RepID=UPI0030FD234E
MNIEQLSYIVEVAKVKSLAEASRTLNISQSALSQAITKLEAELSLKLFHRNRTGATPTKEGIFIVERAQEALHAIYQVKEEARNQLNNSNDLLRISVIPGLTSPIVDTYLSLKRGGSTLKIEVNERASFEIVDDVRTNKIDIGFIAINKSNIDSITDLHFNPIIRGKILAYVSKQSPLANTEVTTPELLRQQTFVIYKDEYVENFITNFQRLYGPIDIFFKTTNLDVIYKAVIELGAVTIGHDISTKFNVNHPPDQIIAIDMEDSIDTSFRFGWITKNDNILSKEANRYIDEVNRVLK